MNNPAFPPSAIKPDEIDLFELCRSMLKQKYLILGIIVLFGLIASAYAFFAPRQYQVSSVLRPAPINEFDAINQSNIYKLSQAEALSKIGTTLESYEARLGFFRQNEGLFKAFAAPGRTSAQTFEAFNFNSIAVTVPTPKQTDDPSALVRINLAYPAGVDGVEILNKFVVYAIDIGRKEISADLNVIIDNRLQELNGKLSAARSNYDTGKSEKIALLLEADMLKRAQLQDELKALRLQLKTERSDRIALLSEAISIAHMLNIKKPTTPSSLADASHTGSGNMIRTEVNSQIIPLYFMGTEALEAERSILQQRKSDDFTEKRIAQIAKELQLLQINRETEILKQRENEDIFLHNVEPLRSEIARLQGLSFDVSHLKLVTIDQMALQPEDPIKPKKTLVLLLGLVLGLFAGLVAAMIRHTYTTKTRTTDSVT